MYRSTSLFLLGLAILVTGCGGSTQTASVSGKVTYKGAPVTGGVITFLGKESRYEAAITKEGTYSISNMVPGDMTIVINTEMLNPKNSANKHQDYAKSSGQKGPGSGGNAMANYMKSKGMEGNPNAARGPASGGPSSVVANKVASSPIPEGVNLDKGEYVAIPEKYTSEKGGLTAKIGSGSNTKNIDLTD